jgi:hypothetical protein
MGVGVRRLAPSLELGKIQSTLRETGFFMYTKGVDDRVAKNWML